MLAKHTIRFVLASCIYLLAHPAFSAGRTLVDVGSSMRYLANSSSPGIGLDWTAEIFAETGWSDGVYGIGYENGSSAHGLITSYVPGTSLSIYTRATFEIDDPASVTQLFLGADYDDGYAAWINGVEVYRSPELPGGTLQWNTDPALHESSNDSYPDFTPLIDISATAIPQLHSGANVLAIGVWNDTVVGAYSSDFVLVPRLHTNSPPAFKVRGPYLQQGTDTSVIVRWDTDLVTGSRVRYGTSPGNLTNVEDSVALVSEHQIELQGLDPDTVYYYSVGTTTEEIAGDDEEHFFRTSPSVGTRRPLRIWVIGDSGTANDDAAAVREAYRSFNGSSATDLWLMLGDNAYDDGTQNEFQEAVFHTYPRLLRNSVLWPTFGNHEAFSSTSSNESGPYYDIFSLPSAGEAGGLSSGTEAYYSFDFANVHFVCLNSWDIDRSPGGDMLTWLEADLAGTAQDWVIAYWHNPPYSKGSHDSDTSTTQTQMRQNALPLLEQWGVDLVLSGHSHSYERSILLDSHYGTSSTLNASMEIDVGDGRPSGDGAYQKSGQGLNGNQGAVYIVAGSSGKTTSAPLNHPVMVESLLELGSVVLDVDGDRLDARFLDNAGALRDSFTMVKNTGVPPTADFSATPAAGLAPLAVDFTDGSSSNTAEWAWDLFGTGSTDSVQRNPSVLYAIPGQYDVSLTATNDAGSNQEAKLAYVCVSGGAPSEVVGFRRLDPSTWGWDAVSGATSYDLVQGDLFQLRDSGGDFSSSILGCLGDDVATNQAGDTTSPPAGQGYFYVARGVSCNFPGSHDAAGSAQTVSRDAGIGASGSACP